MRRVGALWAVMATACGGESPAPIIVMFPDVPPASVHGDVAGPSPVDAPSPLDSGSGTDLDAGLACCTLSDDCPNGTTCVTLEGRCLPLPLPGACWWNGDCAAGKECQGVHVCACGDECTQADKTGLCTPVGGPGGCCDTDDECSGGKLCLLPTAHTCQPKAPAGTCWNDTACEAPAEVCFGVVQCPCNAKCDVPSGPGQCKAKGGVAACCAVAPGFYPPCQDGLACLQVDAASPGACVAALASSQCWTSGDCAAGTTCVGAQICSCEMNCISAPGSCQSLPPGCCATAKDCGSGKTCVGEPASATCEPKPGAGQCWTDADCGPAKVCHGALHCPCNGVCGPLSSTPGSCVAAPPAGCCAVQSDCAPGEVCLSKPGAPGQTWMCAPAGGCTSDADCPGGTCSGAVACACGTDCTPKAGTCGTPPPEGCCATDADCGGGMVCAGSGSGSGLGRCLDAPPPDQCWDASDCADGAQCVAALFCACGATCVTPDVPGVCVPAPLKCCYSDGECGDGQGCYGKQGGLPGACKPKPSGGACWKDSDCKDGKVCKDAKPCGCVTSCSSEPIGTCKKD